MRPTLPSFASKCSTHLDSAVAHLDSAVAHLDSDVAHLDLPVPVHQQVGCLEVAMDDGGLPGVQVGHALGLTHTHVVPNVQFSVEYDTCQTGINIG